MFFLEEDLGFIGLSVREKFNVIAKRCDDKLIEFHYGLGIKGTLPKDYCSFKNLLLNKVTNGGLNSIKNSKKRNGATIFIG